MQIYLLEEVKEELIFQLSEEDAHHCTVVMRNRIGDIIWGTDGKGNAYQLEIINIQKKTVFAKQLQYFPELGEPKLSTCLAFGLLKNPSRMETLIEKAVELGVTHIFPFIAKRSEKKNLSLERALKIATAAVKQCKRSRIPEIQVYTSFHELVQENKKWKIPKFIGFCESQTPISNYKESIANEASFFVIGPEGDFTSEEMEIAHQNQIHNFSLGETRFRAETAGIHVLSINHYLKNLN